MLQLHELVTWHGLEGNSALGGLLDVDFEGVPLMLMSRL
jgi:hypothetical protein